jgi:transcriptional regulator with XRE-family HTH domain
MQNGTSPLGNKLRELRQNHNLTQSQLAEMLNLSTQYISFVEKGVRGAKEDTLNKFADYFKVNLEELKSLRDEQLTYPENAYYNESTELPNHIQSLVDVLLSIEEDECKVIINDMLHQINDRLFNLLKRIELKDIKQELLQLRKNWCKLDLNEFISKEFETNQIGYLPLEKKIYLSIYYDINILKVVLLTGDCIQIQYFDQWMDKHQVSINNKVKIPHLSETQKVVTYIWFSPFLSTFDKYKYIVKEGYEINQIKSNDTQLSWYLNADTNNEVI